MSDSQQELFSHNEWLERMRYYYSKFEEAGSVNEASKLLPGVPIQDIWEAIETLRPRHQFIKEEK
ncbi:MAG: hypothetical protein DRQ78_08345 [Epsilonproteobacteria bacterium]|nr:MAG: hypothetical protein DRQ78_08345 [Campylobacterota bacterium]